MLKISKHMRWTSCTLEDLCKTVLSCVGLYKLEAPKEDYVNDIKTHIKFLKEHTTKYNVAKYIILCNRNSAEFIWNYADYDIDIHVCKFSTLHTQHTKVSYLKCESSHTSSVDGRAHGNNCYDTVVAAIDNDGWLVGITNIMHAYVKTNMYTHIFGAGLQKFDVEI